ncbi:hypothetical protein DL93DRAFT_2170055 [Clavulina sp. PMI_390]|nr:hypothetical protein DL93DRAFT_2170055 [Clavulina sp. PMI_390]
MKIRKLAVASTHELGLASARLRDRIGRLGIVAQLDQRPTDTIWVPIDTRLEDEGLALGALSWTMPALQDNSEESGTPVTQRAVVEHILDSFQWTTGDDIPLSMSNYLISLFLPHRTQFQFFMDVPYFLQCLSLPPCHPESIHPCLRYACYLGACSAVGGRLAQMEPYFVERTRYFLEQALMFAEHITHFLWASMIFGSYFSRQRRLQESYAVISSAARFSRAVGFCEKVDSQKENEALPNELILAPPKSEAEALDRLWLIHSVFVTDQLLSRLTTLPESFVFDERWEPTETSDDGPDKYSWMEVPMARDEELLKVWQSNVHLEACIMQLFYRVQKFSLLISSNGLIGHKEEYKSLCAQFRFHDATIPMPSKKFTLDLLLSRATLYGSGMILYSLRSREDPDARRHMLRCARALVDICKLVQAHKRPLNRELPLLAMIHMMNATRIIAQEIQGFEARGNNRVLTEHCRSIELLLAFLDDMSIIYPAWTDASIVLKDPLTSAANALVA